MSLRLRFNFRAFVKRQYAVFSAWAENCGKSHVEWDGQADGICMSPHSSAIACPVTGVLYALGAKRTFSGISMFVVAIAVTLACPVLAKESTLKENIESAGKNVKSIKKNIQKKKDEASRLRQRQKEIAADLERVEGSIRQQSVRLAQLGYLLKQKETECINAGKRLSQATEEAEVFKGLARARMVSYYKFGSVDLFELFLSSRSIPDLFAREEGLRFILRNDLRTLAEYKSRTDALDRERQKLAAAKQSLVETKDKVRVEAAKLESMRQNRAELLASVTQKERECEREVKELEKAAETLNQTIKSLQADMEKKSRERVIPSLGFTALKGKLEPPLRGRVVGLFGRERRSSSGAVIIRNGIDIQAAAGAEIKSVYTGRVIYSGYLKGYGNILILDHADKYYSLYAHASKFVKQVGSLVKRGEVIGALGDSETDFEETLYFEIRHGGKPENPLIWLNAAALGFN